MIQRFDSPARVEGGCVVQFWQWVVSWWLPEPGPEPDVSNEDELSLIRLEIASLEARLKEYKAKEVEHEKTLMAERSELVLEKLLAFQEQFKHGMLLDDYRELAIALDLLKRTGRDWLQFFAKYLERHPMYNERAIRAFYVNFLEQASKGGSGFLDALQYIAKRDKSSNPFLIGRTL